MITSTPPFLMPESPELKVVLCTNVWAEKFKKVSDESLKEIVLKNEERCKCKDYNRLHVYLASFDDPLFVLNGAVTVLADRHGKNYALNILGLRKPANPLEYIAHFVTGSYPKLENKNN